MSRSNHEIWNNALEEIFLEETKLIEQDQAMMTAQTSRASRLFMLLEGVNTIGKRNYMVNVIDKVESCQQPLTWKGGLIDERGNRKTAYWLRLSSHAIYMTENDFSEEDKMVNKIYMSLTAVFETMDLQQNQETQDAIDKMQEIISHFLEAEVPEKWLDELEAAQRSMGDNSSGPCMGISSDKFVYFDANEIILKRGDILINSVLGEFTSPYYSRFSNYFVIPAEMKDDEVAEKLSILITATQNADLPPQPPTY